MIEVKIKHISFDSASEEEKEIVKEILLRSYAQYESHFTKPKWINYLLELQTASEQAGIDYFILAKVNEEIVGTVQVYRNGEAAYDERAPKIDYPVIRFLAVDPKARGKGIAKKLLDEAITYGKSKQGRKILLHTMEMMPDAARLYESYGFDRNKKYDYYKDELIIKSYTYSLF